MRGCIYHGYPLTSSCCSAPYGSATHSAQRTGTQRTTKKERTTPQGTDSYSLVTTTLLCSAYAPIPISIFLSYTKTAVEAEIGRRQMMDRIKKEMI